MLLFSYEFSCGIFFKAACKMLKLLIHYGDTPISSRHYGPCQTVSDMNSDFFGVPSHQFKQYLYEFAISCEQKLAQHSLIHQGNQNGTRLVSYGVKPVMVVEATATSVIDSRLARNVINSMMMVEQLHQ